jgi:hypothetical protein
MKKILVVLFFFVVSMSVFAQSEVTLNGLDISSNRSFFTADAAIKSIPDSGYNYYQEVSYTEGTLLVVWAYNTLYSQKSTERYGNPVETPSYDVSSFVTFFWKPRNANGYEAPVMKKWFKVNGTPTMLTPSNLTPDNTSGPYNDLSVGFKNFGASTLVFSFLGKSIKLNVNIVDSQIAKTDNVDKIIAAWGFPDSAKKVTVIYPNAEIVDGILYNPNAGSLVNVEHWRYKRYPDLVISIRQNNLAIFGIATSREKQR